MKTIFMSFNSLPSPSPHPALWYPRAHWFMRWQGGGVLLYNIRWRGQNLAAVRGGEKCWKKNEHRQRLGAVVFELWNDSGRGHWTGLVEFEIHIFVVRIMDAHCEDVIWHYTRRIPLESVFSVCFVVIAKDLRTWLERRRHLFVPKNIIWRRIQQRLCLLARREWLLNVITQRRVFCLSSYSPVKWAKKTIEKNKF